MSFMVLDQSTPVPLYTQITDQIREMIIGGDLKPGDSLPPIRQAASQMGIAANTVARAYRDLESQGIVESNGRKGSFIRRDYNPAKQTNLFIGPIEKYMADGWGKEEIEVLFFSALNLTDKEKNK